MFDLLNTSESCIYAKNFITGCVDKFAATEMLLLSARHYENFSARKEHNTCFIRKIKSEL
jgi:hypothetical protein